MKTIEEAIDSYSNWHQNRVGETWWNQSYAALRMLFRQRLKEPLDTVTPLFLDDYFSVRRQNVAPATVNKDIVAVKQFFRRMLLWGDIATNPSVGLQYYTNPPGRIRFLAPKEWEKVEAECNVSGDIGKAILFALYTGMRRGEILSLSWGQVLLDIGVISLYQTKNKTPRTIPLHPKLLTMLQDKMKCCNWIFCFARHKPIKNSRVHRLFNEFMSKLEIPDFTFHSLRHTFASYLVMNGTDLRTTAQLLGHKRIETTLRYSHLSLEHLRKAVLKVEPIQTDATPPETGGSPGPQDR